MRTVKLALVVYLLAWSVPGVIFSQDLPMLEIAEREYDFGRVRPSAGALSHDFIIHNKGRADLVINKVTPG